MSPTVQKPQNIQFIVITDKEKHQIITFKKLKPATFCFILVVKMTKMIISLSKWLQINFPSIRSIK